MYEGKAQKFGVETSGVSQIRNLNQGNAINPRVHRGEDAAREATRAETMVRRFAELLSMSKNIAIRQEQFLIRVRGNTPQEVGKEHPAPTPGSVLSALNMQFDELERVLSTMHSQLSEIESIA